MAPRDPSGPARDLNPELRRRLEALLATACEQLDRPACELRCGFDPALDAVQDALGAGMRWLRSGSGRDAERLGTIVTALREVHEDIRSARFEHRVSAFAAVRESIDVMEDLETPRELVDAACGEIRRAGHFDRVILSCVDGSHWVPRRASFDGAPGEADRFIEAQGAGGVRLQPALPEADVVRRQRPVLVADEQPAAPSIVEALEGVAYVAAPVRSAGRVLGMIHADRHASGAGVDSLDLDVVWAFAEAFGPLADSALLRRYVQTRRAVVRQRLDHVSRLLEELAEAEVQFPVVRRIGAGHPTLSASGSDLTRREREVLGLMARGASNREIGETLYVAIGTVKGHVRNILRKLGAVNRAEAVSWYLQQQFADTGSRA